MERYVTTSARQPIVIGTHADDARITDGSLYILTSEGNTREILTPA